LVRSIQFFAGGKHRRKHKRTEAMNKTIASLASAAAVALVAIPIIALATASNAGDFSQAKPAAVAQR
jgi:hypothetical protein